VRRHERGRGKARLYLSADLQRLKARAEARSGHAPVAQAALRWGEPVLSTAISSITADGPHYRGRSAVALAVGGASFESVAELLWSGTLDDRARWPAEDALPFVRAIGRTLPRGAPPPYSFLATVLHLAASDSARRGGSARELLQRCRTLVRVLAAILSHSTGRSSPERACRAQTVAESIAESFGCTAQAHSAIDRALVLVADHELNASTFTARIIASTGANFYASVMGCMAALTGPRHGGASALVEALLDEIGSAKRARAVIEKRVSANERVPGFGHPLYPRGDPRFSPLMAAAEALAKGTRRHASLQALMAAMQRRGREPPNLDLGLVAVCRALALPQDAAAALFALGRVAGCIAHVLEQTESPCILRPRARYVGPRGDASM
jgi:citrate synthase